MAVVLVMALIGIATAAGVYGDRWEEQAPLAGRVARGHLIGYWLLTVIVAYELAAGAVWDLLRIDYVRVMLAHLGYPGYLLVIPGALVLLEPRLPRLKEWAYAGAFFDYSGAAASHFLVGDRPTAWVFPLIFCGLTLASWKLRPESRRLAAAPRNREQRVSEWVLPVLTVAAMLVVGFFTLPKGAPPL